MKRELKPAAIQHLYSQTCSMCGEDWNRHPENPTVQDCIAILKTELQYLRNPIVPVVTNYTL